MQLLEKRKNNNFTQIQAHYHSDQTLILLSKVWTEKNVTCVLYCSSKTIAAGAFNQANHQLYYLLAWKLGIVRLCKPKIVGNMSKNVRIGICENSAICYDSATADTSLMME